MADNEIERVSLNIDSGSYGESLFWASSDYLAGLNRKIKQLLDEKKFFDVILIAGLDGFKVKAHKLVLYAASPYFKTLFKSQNGEINIFGINGDSLKNIVNYIYTTSITLTSDSVEDIIKVATIYELDSLVYLCTNFIVSHMDLSNCIAIELFAEYYKIQPLHAIAQQYINQNSMQVRNLNEFLQVDVDHLCKYISSDNMYVSSEKEVFHSIMLWVNHDKEIRSPYLDVLLEHVRFPLLTPEFIAQEVEPVCKTSNTINLLYNAMTWHSAPNLRSSLFPESHTQLRSTPKAMFAITGWSTSKDKLRVACYNFAANIWTYNDWPCPQTRRSDFGYTTINEKLIIAGGALETGESTNTVECLDLNTLEWTMAPPMALARRSFGMDSMNEKVYVIGGNTESDCVEQWKQLEPEWETILPLDICLGPGTRLVSGTNQLCISKKVQSYYCKDPNMLEHSIYCPMTNVWNEAWLRTTGVLLGTGIWRTSSGDYFVIVRRELGITIWNIRDSTEKNKPFKRDIRPECTDVKLLGNRLIFYGTNVYYVYDLSRDEWIEISEIENSNEKIILFSNKNFVP